MSCENCSAADRNAEKLRMIQTVDAIVSRVGTTREVTIPLLQALQDEFGFLPSDALERVYESRISTAPT